MQAWLTGILAFFGSVKELADSLGWFGAFKAVAAKHPVYAVIAGVIVLLAVTCFLLLLALILMTVVF